MGSEMCIRDRFKREFERRFLAFLISQTHKHNRYLDVPGPFEQNDYDSLKIHYEFHTSQNDPSKDPVLTWHQGGPGGSSVSVGAWYVESKSEV